MTPPPGYAARRGSSADPGSRRVSSVDPGSRRVSVTAGQIKEKAKYDVLTLRQWFNQMDTQHSGHVTKQEWFHFLRCNPRLRQMMLHGDIGDTTTRDRFSDESQERLKQEAKEMKRLLKIVRELDADRSGTLEFEEFVEFFRRSGNLIEYGAEAHHHPRARLASIVGHMHANPDTIDEALVEECEQLAKWNMYGERRQSLEDDVLQQVTHPSTAAARMANRRSGARSVEPPSSIGWRSETPRQRRASEFTAVGSRMLGLY